MFALFARGDQLAVVSVLVTRPQVNCGEYQRPCPLQITWIFRAVRCFVIRVRDWVGDWGEDKEARSGLWGEKGASLWGIEVNKIVPVREREAAALRSLLPLEQEAKGTCTHTHTHNSVLINVQGIIGLLLCPKLSASQSNLT